MNKWLLVSAFFIMICLPVQAEKRYFYTGKQYGSEYLYNPLTLIFNAGYDILQCREGEERDLFKIPYGPASKNVFMNLGNPGRAIRVYGTEEFIMEEVFPLTFSEDARWWPNYQLHLIGGGVTYTYLCDYFSLQGYSDPTVFAFLAYMTYHFTNEIVENNYRTGYSTDAVADIYIFDLAGVLLFTSEKVRRFFAKKMNLADWSMQPVFIGDKWHLENNGQYFSLKWLLPFNENRNWHFFYYWGLNFVLGISYKFEQGYALSFGAGVRSKAIKMKDFKTGKATSTYAYTGGIFLDKYNSLLVSIVMNINYREILQINVYPGLFSQFRDFPSLPGGRVSPGLYLAVSEDLEAKFGIIFDYTFTENMYRGKLVVVNQEKLLKNSSYLH